MSQSTHQRSSIAIINDESTLLKLLVHLVEDAGFKAIPFTGASAALAAMKSDLPDLIITDLYMPELDGWRFCRLLRSPEYPHLNRIPILIVSATFAGAEAKQIATDLGAEAMLPMPIEGPLLIEAVKTILTGEAFHQIPRVLIVEDESAISRILQKHLEANSYTTDIAATLAKAEEQLGLHTYDLAVIDYHLPDGRGDRLLPLFGKFYPDTACLMMTADPNPELALAWMQQGASAYVRKPFQPDYVVTLCAQARRERALLRTEDRLEERTRELRASEEKQRIFAEASFEGIAISEKGRLIDATDQLAEMLGYDRSEMIGREVFDFVAPSSIELVREKMRGQCEVAYTHELMRKNGEILVVESRGRQLLSQGRTLRVTAIRDITESRRLEERLRQMEKMTAIGQLAGGIAHDFNNQLTGVLGYSEMLAGRLDDPKLKRYAEIIQTAARRSADLTAQLLAFSRKGKYLTIPVDLHTVIHEVVSLLTHSLDKRIEIHQHLDANPSLVSGDPAQLQNALLNIAINASDAMPEGGSFTLATSVVDLAKDPEDPELEPGRYLELRLTDTGSGMDRETMKHIFEPFFTTKEQGKGTGLGLAAVHGTVRNHKGTVRLESTVGKGTTFFLYFPLLEEARATRNFDLKSTPSHREAQILVVDDEAVARDLMSDMLSNHGFKVLSCASGEEAVSCYAQAWEQVDLVILDMVMPRMNGRDVFVALKKINPGIKAILASGYSLNDEARKVLDEGVKAFIQKPFSEAALLGRVNAVLTA